MGLNSACFMQVRKKVVYVSQQGLWIIDDFWNKTLVLNLFQMYFLGAVSTTFRAPFSPIVFEKRQKSLQPISLKLGNSQQNNQD